MNVSADGPSDDGQVVTGDAVGLVVQPDAPGDPAGRCGQELSMVEGVVGVIGHAVLSVGAV